MSVCPFEDYTNVIEYKNSDQSQPERQSGPQKGEIQAIDLTWKLSL